MPKPQLPNLPAASNPPTGPALFTGGGLIESMGEGRLRAGTKAAPAGAALIDSPANPLSSLLPEIPPARWAGELPASMNDHINSLPPDLDTCRAQLAAAETIYELSQQLPGHQLMKLAGDALDAARKRLHGLERAMLACHRWAALESALAEPGWVIRTPAGILPEGPFLTPSDAYEFGRAEVQGNFTVIPA